jgi:predicted MPP superfamily phosphohydrolase
LVQVAIGRKSLYEPRITVQRSILSFLIFLTVALGIVASAHYYIWVRLVRDVGFAPGLRRLLGWSVVLLGLSVPATFILSRTLPPNNGRWLLHAAYSWMGVLLLLVVALGLADLVRLLSALAFAQGPSVQPERRLFLKRLFAGAATLATGTTTALAISEGLAQVKIKNVRIPLARLPASMHGFTIVQITDLHMGPTLREEFARDIVARVNALKADLIAITGDLVDGSVDRLAAMVSIFGNLRARHGVYFVTGNHEYYSGVDEWLVELKRIGIRVLRNERVSIGSPEASFDLIGIDDAHAHQFGNGHGANLPKATLGRDPAREAVLLAHQPRAVYEAQQHGIGLQLSGHTHGGQLWPFNYLVRLQQPVIKGLEKIGNVWIYVSAGTGYWGPPMRLAAPAEITRVTLASGKIA